MREAPSIDIAQMLVSAGANVRAYDPVAVENARSLLPAVAMFNNPYDMAKNSDALIVITEWNEFKQLDLERIRTLMKTPNLFDGRNIYDPAEVRSLGFSYRGVGRGFNGN
jgi:UDPglucose 6-dehydrogenase